MSTACEKKNGKSPNFVVESFTYAFSKKITWVALVCIPLIVALFGTLYVNTFKNLDIPEHFEPAVR